MRLISSGSVACLLMMFAGVTWADCTRPRPSFEVPEGSTATKEQIATAQKHVVSFADEITQYVRCLQGELGQKSIGKSDAERTTLEQQYQTAHKAAADEVTGLANCFNAQLESFKTSGGGTQMRPADCSEFIAAAAKSTTSAKQSVEELIIEASGHRTDIDTGSWVFFLARDDKPRECGPTNADRCLYRAVIVTNDSDEALECTAEITFDGTEINGKDAVRAQALVMARSSRIIVTSMAKQAINASVFNAQCIAREPLAKLDTPANCKYEVVKPIAIADYYPPESREAGEEGPVTVEFTLRGKAANPTNVRVVASSLFPALDAAAVKAVSDMVMSSNCPKTRYRLRVSFQLD